MLGTIKRDLLIRGLDPLNVEVGPSGTFVEKTKPISDTTEEKVHKNALVHFSEPTQLIDIEANNADDKSAKVKRKPKSE